MSGEIARIRWQSPPPTSVDEELAAYDDGTVWLVVRSPRDGTPSIGTWRSTLSRGGPGLIDGVRREMDLSHPMPDPLLIAIERMAAAVREHPVATATFSAAVVPPGGGLALLAVGGGLGPAAFELDRDAVVVHLMRSGTEIGWHRPERCRPGSCLPSRPASVASRGRRRSRPARTGPSPCDRPRARRSRRVALEVSGYLRDALPEGAAYRAFSVRTADVPLDK